MATLRTVTVRPSGGDYTSLAAAIAGEAADLVALDRQLDIVCSAMQDTTQVTVDGFTTDATRYIRIVAASGAEAQMPYNTSTSYRLETTVGAGDAALRIMENFTRVERIQVRGNMSGQDGSFQYSCIEVLATGVRILGCAIRGDLSGWTAGSTEAFGINGGVDVAGSNYYANNLIYGIDYATHANASGVKVFNHTSGKTYLYNNTIVQCGECVSDGFLDVVARNNITVPVSGGVGFTSGFDATSSNNASTDTTAPGSNSRQSQTFTFVSTGTLDYHLTSGDGGARDFGVDLSADANFPISTDFDAQTRTGTWDIGADEFQTSSSSATATPTTGSVLIVGLAPTGNAFTNVRYQEVLINAAGSPVSNRTGLRFTVWYSGQCAGAPDLSYSDLTTGAAGTASYSIATGSLVFGQKGFGVITDGGASLSSYTCGLLTFTYS